MCINCFQVVIFIRLTDILNIARKKMTDRIYSYFNDKNK